MQSSTLCQLRSQASKKHLNVPLGHKNLGIIVCHCKSMNDTWEGMSKLINILQVLTLLSDC